MTQNISIEVYSDVICPWCLIGHHRLQQALGQLDGIDVDVTWLPFELNPDMPVAGMDRRAYLEGKFGPDRAKQVYGRIAETLKAEGLDADVSKIQRTPNTFKAHRLLYLIREQAGDNEAAKRLKLALFDAYFRQGADIGTDEVLMRCALEAGLDKAQTLNWLASEEGTHEVRQLEARAHQIGVQGVPFFIIAGKYGVSGAQPPELLAQAISEAAGGT